MKEDFDKSHYVEMPRGAPWAREVEIEPWLKSFYDSLNDEPTRKVRKEVKDALGLPTDPRSKKSCLDCAHLLVGEKEIDRFMSSSGPVHVWTRTASDITSQDESPTVFCTAKQKVLARSTFTMTSLQLDALLDSAASDCEKYADRSDDKTHGVAPRSQPGVYSTTMPVALPGIVPKSSGYPRPKNCGECRFFDSYSASLGWDLPVCLLLGKLLPTDSTAIATACPQGSVTPLSVNDAKVRSDLRSSFYDRLFVELRSDYMPPSLTARKDTPGKTTPPELIPRPGRIRADLAKYGIVALRDVHDPTGRGSSIKVPVFDLSQEHLSTPPELLARVPKTKSAERPEDYIDHAGLVYQALVSWFKLGMTPAVWGPAGVGKTELFRHLAWMMGLPFMRISITGTSEVDDIIGKMMYSPERGTYFHHGRLVQAWSQLGIVVVDEPNLGPPSLWHALRPLTDNSKQLVLDVADGAVIESGKFSFLGFAMNPAWDYRNTGANDLADADGSRLIHLDCPYPPDDIELNIIIDSLKLSPAVGKEKIIGEYVVKVGKSIRDSVISGQLPCTWGVRQSVKAAQLLCFFPPEKAFALALGNGLDPATSGILKGIVLSNTPQGSR